MLRSTRGRYAALNARAKEAAEEEEAAAAEEEADLHFRRAFSFRQMRR